MVSKGYTMITMNQLLFDYRVWILASLHCAIGVIAALVARRKGYSFQRWLGLGLIGGTPTLFLALWKPPHNSLPNSEKVPR